MDFRSIPSLLLLAVLGAAAAEPAAALSTDPRISSSPHLGVEVFGSGPGWCAETAVVQVVAENPGFFGKPDLEALVRRLGTEAFPKDCPSARTMIITGIAKPSGSVVWRGQTTAARQWSLGQEAAPPALPSTTPTSTGAKMGVPLADTAAGRAVAAALRGFDPARDKPPPAVIQDLTGRWIGGAVCQGQILSLRLDLEPVIRREGDPYGTAGGPARVYISAMPEDPGDPKMPMHVESLAFAASTGWSGRERQVQTVKGGNDWILEPAFYARPQLRHRLSFDGGVLFGAIEGCGGSVLVKAAASVPDVDLARKPHLDLGQTLTATQLRELVEQVKALEQAWNRDQATYVAAFNGTVRKQEDDARAAAQKAAEDQRNARRNTAVDHLKRVAADGEPAPRGLAGLWSLTGGACLSSRDQAVLALAGNGRASLTTEDEVREFGTWSVSGDVLTLAIDEAYLRPPGAYDDMARANHRDLRATTLSKLGLCPSESRTIVGQFRVAVDGDRMTVRSLASCIFAGSETALLSRCAPRP